MNINPQKTNVILGEKCVTLWGSDTISDTMCGNRINISPLSFYQVNTLQAERLYAKALEFAKQIFPSPVVFFAHRNDVFIAITQSLDAGVLGQGWRAHDGELMDLLHLFNNRQRTHDIAKPPARHRIRFREAINGNGSISHTW